MVALLGVLVVACGSQQQQEFRHQVLHWVAHVELAEAATRHELYVGHTVVDSTRAFQLLAYQQQALDSALAGVALLQADDADSLKAATLGLLRQRHQALVQDLPAKFRAVYELQRLERQPIPPDSLVIDSLQQVIRQLDEQLSRKTREAHQAFQVAMQAFEARHHLAPLANPGTPFPTQP
jgi:hypothetical protein